MPRVHPLYAAMEITIFERMSGLARELEAINLGQGFPDEQGPPELIAAAGLDHPGELKPQHFMHRAAPDRVVTFAELYRQLAPGELLAGTSDPRFREAWFLAQADSFAPQTGSAFSRAAE